VGLPDEMLAEVSSPADDPELAYLKRSYRAEFLKAFRDALATLSVRERNVLRQHFLYGLGIDQLAIAYQVHRATAARWIQRACVTLLDSTKRSLRKRLGADHAEIESVMRLVESRLEVSLRRFLAEKLE